MPAAGGALRAVARARTEQEFIRSFAPFVERDTLFIPTSSTRPVGTRQRFVMLLADGEPVMQGEAEIIECFSNKDGPGSRNGLRLRVISLDEQSRAIHERLLERAASVGRKHSQSLRAQTAAPLPVEKKTAPDERAPAPDKLPTPDLDPDSDEPTIVKPLADLDKPEPAQKSAALDKPAPPPRTTVAFEAPRALEPTKLPDRSAPAAPAAEVPPQEKRAPFRAPPLKAPEEELATNRTPPARPRQDTLIGTPSPPINAALAAMIEPRTPAVGSPRQSSPNFTDLKEKPTPVVGIDRGIFGADLGGGRAPQKSAPQLPSAVGGAGRAPQKSAPEIPTAVGGAGRAPQKSAPEIPTAVGGAGRAPQKSAPEIASAIGGAGRAPQKSASDVAVIDSSELQIASPAAPPPAPSALARERQAAPPELSKSASGALRLQAMRMHTIDKGPTLPKLPEPAKPPPREPKPEEPRRPAEPKRNPLKDDPESARAILIRAIKSNRPAPKKSDELPPAEVRVPGSDLILPANPFGELSPTALEQFIECTLFDAGPNAGEPAAVGSAFPPPMPASIAAPAPYPSYVPAPGAYEAMERPPDSRIAPNARAPSIPPPSAVALAPPISAPPPPMPPYQPSVPAPATLVAAQSEERTWTSRLLAATLAIVAGTLVAALGIGAGYVLRDVAGQRAQSKTTPVTTGAAESHSAASDPAKLEDEEPTNTAPPPASVAAPQAEPSAAPTESASAAAAVPNAEGCEASVRTDPPGATVWWNGDNLGKTPLDDVRVRCTDATVVLELSRYVPRQHKVTPAPTAPVSIFEKLLHADAQLFVSSSVAGTTFQVNGVAIGAAPTSTWVQTGTYAEIFAYANGRAFWSVHRAINRRLVYVRAELNRKAAESAKPVEKSSAPESKRERASTKPEKPTASEPKKKLPSGI